jgi:MoxR-like ATPase
MPSDVVGTSVFNLQTGTFHLKQGPIFTQILLADEINRAPAKTQSALLEAMEERQVTLEGDRYPLERPFFVVATQNPVEYEGTYPLPEAQLDRFLFKILVTYPSAEEEKGIMRMYDRGLDPRRFDAAGVEPVVSPSDLDQGAAEILRVTVDESIVDYCLAIVTGTRESRDLVLGASPRASIALLTAAKSLACLRGRTYVIPDDVKFLAGPVLRHRLLLKAEAEIEGLSADAVVDRMLARLTVPR